MLHSRGPIHRETGKGRCETKTFSKKICAEQQDRNVLEFFHHSESRAEFDAIAMEQANIQKNEVRCAIMKEFQGRQAIRNEYNLIVCLLCK